MNINRDKQIREHILFNGRHSYGYHLILNLINILEKFPDAKPSQKWLSEYPHDIAEGIIGSKTEDGIIRDMSWGIGLKEMFPEIGGDKEVNSKIISSINNHLVLPSVERHRKMMHHIIWNYMIRLDNDLRGVDKCIPGRLQMLKTLIEPELNERLSYQTLERYLFECSADAVLSNMENRDYLGGPHPLNEIIEMVIPEKNHGLHGHYMREVAKIFQEYDAGGRVREINRFMTIDSIMNETMPNLGLKEDEHQEIVGILKRTLERWKGYRPNLLVA